MLNARALCFSLSTTSTAAHRHAYFIVIDRLPGIMRYPESSSHNKHYRTLPQSDMLCCCCCCCLIPQAAVAAHGWSFCRIDGTMASTDARQAEVDKFQAAGAKIPVFLLTTQVRDRLPHVTNCNLQSTLLLDFCLHIQKKALMFLPTVVLTYCKSPILFSLWIFSARHDSSCTLLCYRRPHGAF